MAGKRCLSCIDNQQEITISLKTMKTTTKTGENQNSVEKCEKKISKPFKPLAGKRCLSKRCLSQGDLKKQKK